MNADINYTVLDSLSLKRNLSGLQRAQRVMLFAIAYLSFTRVQALSSESRDNHAQCLFPLQLNTNAVYSYRFLEIPTNIKLNSRIVFEAKSSRDVHVALAPDTNGTNFYEIVIGAGDNTFSTIRRCKECADLIYRGTAYYLNPVEYRRFWVTFDNNGTIGVGKGEEISPFLEWKDPNPMDINYLGYSTGWKSKGEFRFCHFAKGVNSTLTPPLSAVTSTELWNHATLIGELFTQAFSGETATDKYPPERPSNSPETTHTGSSTIWLIAAILLLLLLLSTCGMLVIRRKQVKKPIKKPTERGHQHQSNKLSPSNNSNTYTEVTEKKEFREQPDVAYSNVAKTKDDFIAPSYVSYAKTIRHTETKDDTATDGRIHHAGYESFKT